MPASALLTTLAVGLLASANILHAQSQMETDLKQRNPEIRWPAGYDPATAPLFSHNDLTILVPCSTVFRTLTDAEAWPTWLVFAKDVKTPNDEFLQPGITFSWSIFGKPIQSRIDVFEPNRQLGWTNLASHYYQAWLFQDSAVGCRVTTEEIGVGNSAALAASIGDSRTHRAHDLWLASMRWMAEGGTKLR